jgi:RecB family endonuclease NucS
MRLVVARCEVEYTGRLSAHLPMATRLIMVKADGCVAVHSDEGAYKPLNWMTAPNHLEEREGEWVVTNRVGERLVIRFEEILSDAEYPLGIGTGLAKDGVEAELQRLLAEAPFVLEEGLSLLRREYPTDLGPVDLLCRDPAGQVVAVEVKRRGEIEGVEQLARYLERLNRDATLAPVRGILAAQSITPQARTLAGARGLACVEVDYDGLRGVEGNHPRLFPV